MACIYQIIRLLSEKFNPFPLFPDPLVNAPVIPCQRVKTPCLLVPFDQNVIRGFQEQYLVLHPGQIQLLKHLRHLRQAFPAPYVHSQSRLIQFTSRDAQQIRHLWDQRHRQIVHTKIPHILQHLKRRTLSCSRHSCHNHTSHLRILPVSLLPAQASLQIVLPPCRQPGASIPQRRPPSLLPG